MTPTEKLLNVCADHGFRPDEISHQTKPNGAPRAFRVRFGSRVVTGATLRATIRTIRRSFCPNQKSPRNQNQNEQETRNHAHLPRAVH